MRILVGADAPPNPDSGAAGTVYATSVALRGLGCAVDEFWDFDLSHRIPHWNLHYLLELPRSYRSAVASRAREQHYDVIQLSQPHAWLAALDHRRKLRKGVFVNRSHGLESMADSALSHWYRRLGESPNRFPQSVVSPLLRRRLHRHIDLVARYADGMIVPAADIRDFLIRHHGANPDRIAVIHHGVPDRLLSAPQVPMDPRRLKRLLHVGQYSFIKGPQLLASAANHILAGDGEARLTWVCGRANHQQVLDHFDAAVRARVRLLDWMPQEALLDLYDEHGVHLSHSLYEGAAKACIEGTSRGQVLVASRVGALKDIIRHGENGFLVDVGDIDAMAQAALGVMSDLSAARRIGAAAAKTAASLSWRACASSSVEFYRRLLVSKDY